MALKYKSIDEVTSPHQRALFRAIADVLYNGDVQAVIDNFAAHSDEFDEWYAESRRQAMAQAAPDEAEVQVRMGKHQ